MIDLPPLTFSYGVVEKALAVAYGIADAARPRGFRSMLSNLQKLGALGAQARVGRGAHLVYTPVEMHRLVLALEFCELGVPPATAVSLVDSNWEGRLKPIVAAAARGLVRHEPGGNDVLLYLGGVGLRTASLRGETAPSVPNIDRCSLAELPIAITRLMTVTPTDPASPRALVMNLSARLRVFHTALADADADEQRAERSRTLAGDEPPSKTANAPELK